MSAEPRVFVVDDDPSVLRSIGRVLRVNGFAVETFASPRLFLDRLPYDGVACLLLDMRMPELSGFDVQGAIATSAPDLPTVFLSGTSDVHTAATAMRQGAIDFLGKPVDERELIEAVTRGFRTAAENARRRGEDAEYTRRFARLTRRESEVCALVAQGLLNKQIAHELGTSEKTVKVHRARVMQKLEVDSVAALVWLMSGHRTADPSRH